LISRLSPCRALADNAVRLRVAEAFLPFIIGKLMRRIVNYLVNNIREHLMLYIVLWSLLALLNILYIVFF
jgi:hypothetical protein